MWHSTAAEFCHSVEQHTSIGFARRDDSGIGNPKIALARTSVEDGRFLQRLRVIQFQHDLPASPTEPVAVGTVGVQVTACPPVEWLRFIGWVHQCRPFCCRVAIKRRERLVTLSTRRMQPSCIKCTSWFVPFVACTDR